MRILAVLVLLALAMPAPAMAQASRLLRVVGIGPAAVLDIRESPSASARIVGAVPPGGRGIRTLGEARPGWLAIRWGDVEGFAEERYLAADAPIRRGRGPGRVQAGWWLLLGSFSDPAGIPSSIARTSEEAARCGLRAFSAPSGDFSDLARGFTVVVVGPFRSRAGADVARAQARPCLPEAFVKASSFGQ